MWESPGRAYRESNIRVWALGLPQLSWNPGCKSLLATSHLRPALAIVDGLMDMQHALGDGIVELLLGFVLKFLGRSL